MAIVSLVSGGLDSTLMGVMAKEEGLKTFPLFIDYGQRSRSKEWTTCKAVHKKYRLPTPIKMDIKGYGAVISSGLTSKNRHIKNEAFTPGRNLLFILMGGAYACQVNASAVAIGLLSEITSLFPDQTSRFLFDSERALRSAFGSNIKVIAPLSLFTKIEVVSLAQERGLTGTYSCHSGGSRPCGKCIACLEYQ